MGKYSRKDDDVVLRHRRTCSKMPLVFAWMITIKKEELESVGELSEVCSQIILKCLHLARIDRPDILWSVSKFARSVTKWTQACDRRLARLISSIHHSSDYRQYCHVGNTAQHCRLGLFQDSDFADDLEYSKSTSLRVPWIFRNRTLIPITWMFKKQTLVSHGSTISNIISLDAGLRMDGLPALDSRDVVIEVLLSSNNTQPQTKRATPKQASGNRCDARDRNVDQLSNVDHVIRNAFLKITKRLSK